MRHARMIAVPLIAMLPGMAAGVTPVLADSPPTDLMACGPTVDPSTLRAIMHVESGANVLSINVNGTSVQSPPARDAADATAIAESWIARGYSVDLGLMQVNNRNLASLGYSVAQMFDPCTNVRAGASILTADYLSAQDTWPDPQVALRAALSAYNTGNFERGFFNGYVAKYYGPHAVAIGGPIITAAAYHAPAPTVPLNPYTASPSVYTRQEVAND